MGVAYLVIVTLVPLENLPAQTTVAVFRIPPGGLGVKDSLGESEPLGLIGWWVRVGVFGGRHDGKAPEALVVVAFGQGLVSRHVVIVVANLEQETLGNNVIEGVVARVVPVVNEGAEHGTGLPPCGTLVRWFGNAQNSRGREGEYDKRHTVIWIRQKAGGASGLVAVVEREHVFGELLGHIFDRV